MGVLTACKPRKEILKGDLEDAIFAADFGDLIADKAPPVYGNAKTFFQNTHAAKQLRKVVQLVFGRLAETKEGGATIRLSTGFGGGKTHTLMALWHLASHIDDSSMGTELLAAAGRPKKVTVVAVDASKAGYPDFGSHGNVKVHSLWGELFYQFGGATALKALGKADDPEASPNEGAIEKVFPNGPVLLLLDELVIYMAKLSERGQGNILGFLNSLSSVVGKRHETVLVVTDPARQIAYAKQAAKLADALPAAAGKLDEMFGRKASDFDPIGDESALVIVRRLFEKVDAAAAQGASAAYHSLYQRVLDESADALPQHAVSSDYSSKLVQCYPFHSRLLDTAQDRLGALQDFQKSRGVLRLFARILRDVWEANEDIQLISAGEINWSSPRIQADLLQRLNRDNFKAAVSADIEKHAAELDGGVRGVHTRAASALLLESLPLQINSGLDGTEITLAILRPEDAGPEPAEALDRLAGVCWHTYPMAGGKGLQFRYEPNIIKQIEERMGQISIEDARARLTAEAQGYFSGPTFKLAAWPETARQVPESADLQLALCEDEKKAQWICANCDDSDPNAPIPRAFQNAIVAIAPTPSLYSGALDQAQRLKAAEAIESEAKGESGKMIREQLQRIKPQIEKQFKLQTRRCFDRVVLARNTYGLEEQYQVPEDQILQGAKGQECLRKFLNAKNLVYQPGDAIDVDRFLTKILPGTVPIPDMPQTYTAKAIHERFLGSAGLRLIPDHSVVRQTILKALSAGKVVVRLPSGQAYDAAGCVEGPEGYRRRSSGTLSPLPLQNDVYVTTADSPVATKWLQEDAPAPIPGGSPGPVPPPPPPPPNRVDATTWEKAVEFAGERPLIELRLIASTPTAAATLAPHIQPLGANSISLSVSVNGVLKDGGEMNFAANDVKPSHPVKPLSVAQMIFNALNEASKYQAVLRLGFEESGRTDMQDALQTLQEAIPDGVTVRATFGKAKGANA
jgi:hypothetical protein